LTFTDPPEPDPARGPTHRVVAAGRPGGPSAVVATVRHWLRIRTRGQRLVRSLPTRFAVPVGRIARRFDARIQWRHERPDPRPAAAVDAPLVTVIVTSLDRSELLAIALRSVQLQDLAELECIVVDDGSTDDTVAVAQAFAAVDPRVRIVQHDVRRGLSAARNTGVALASSPHVCFLDDDDFLLEGSLRSRLESLVDQPIDVAGSFCDWINTDPGVGLEAFRARKQVTRRGTVHFGTLATGAPFIATSPLVRTQVLRAVGGFDETFTRAEDTELWFRIARLGYRFVDAEHVGVAYRRSPGSMVLAAPAAQLDLLLAVFRRAAQPDPSVKGKGPFPRTRGLASEALDHALAPQVLRYIAMIAAADADLAVEVGRRELGDGVRRALDVPRQTRDLARYVISRTGTTDKAGVVRIERAVRDVLTAITLDIATSWEAPADPNWLAMARTRATPIGAPPSIVADDATVRAAVDGAVVLVAEARYHVDEIGPLGEALEARGVPTCFMLSPKTVPAAVVDMGRYRSSILPFSPDHVGRAAAVVTLNDWGPARELLEIAAAAGVPTFAKVEGVQDFDDVASPHWSRRPYRTASYILAQGPNDVDRLPDTECIVVGSTRLERIFLAPPVIPGSHALVNLNFTYQILTEHRDRWLQTVVDALVTADVSGLVSTHPAECATVVGLPVASKPLRHEITKAGMLVSRFSTAPFEAMARGVPFIYHNPHAEQFPTFREPRGAFLVTTGTDELRSAVVEIQRWRSGYRERSRDFFLHQVDVDVDRSSAERAADAIIERLSRQ
jgi:Glycosyl transferase family 2